MYTISAEFFAHHAIFINEEAMEVYKLKDIIIS